MYNKYIKPFITSVLIILTLFCFNACSVKTNETAYVTAKEVNTFSALNDTVCWTTGNSFFLENNTGLKSSLDYNLQEDPYYDKPLLDGNYLYFVGGVYNYSKHEIYIARMNYTEETPKLEKLTDVYKDILSYTVYNNNLYYICLNGQSDDKFCIKNLSTNEEEVFATNVLSPYFCTNGEKIITCNKIFDIKTKESKTISEEENLTALGVIDNYYYCYYNDNEGYEVLRINLDNNSVSELCQLPYGMEQPKMYDNKILFADIPDSDVIVSYHYYDCSAKEFITVMNSDGDTPRYIYYDMFNDSSGRYDYMIYNNMYYFHYPDMVTRVDMITKKEELFQSVLEQNDNGWYSNKYAWLTYDEYLANKS